MENIERIIPGNYFLSKSFEWATGKFIQKNNNISINLKEYWALKKFLVYYSYVFSNNSDFETDEVYKEVADNFNSFISSLNKKDQETAEQYFFYRDIRDLDKIVKWTDFYDYSQQPQDKRKLYDYKTRAKKLYWMYLIANGGQDKINKDVLHNWIPSGIKYHELYDLIEKDSRKEKGTLTSSVLNDVAANLRNTRQLFYYYGIFYKFKGKKRMEEYSTTQIGDLLLKGNIDEIAIIMEHQKLKMISQPPNVEIAGVKGDDYSDFFIELNPYFKILKYLNKNKKLTNDMYKYVISRHTSIDSDLNELKTYISKFKRKRDKQPEDFTKELKKYMHGLNIIKNIRIDSGRYHYEVKSIDGFESYYIFIKFYKNIKKREQNRYITMYKNIIVVPDDKNPASLYNDNIIYILWFAKQETSFFDKNKIREPHIWKNVEWGKREKNYSEGGKDPSNVWIPTKDNGKGKITEHINLKIEGSIDRLFTGFTNINEGTKWYYYDKYMKKDSVINIKKNIRNQSNEFLKMQQTKSLETNLNRYEASDYTSYKENYIYFDTSENMNYIENSVDLVVTSPPYWNLKDYFKEGQIGKESYEEYLDRLLTVWMECKRVMKPNATLWININIRRYKKKPYFIPSDYIEQLKEIGFYYKEVFIWHKSSSIPTTKYNLSDKFEVFLVFSLSKEISVNYKEILKFDEYKNEHLKYGTIWNVNRKAGSIGKKFIHPAIFPTELIERVILLNTLEGNLILDPFIGSGSSGISAIETRRNFIGIEYNENFYDLIKNRFISETKLSNDSIKRINNTMIFPSIDSRK